MAAPPPDEPVEKAWRVKLYNRSRQRQHLPLKIARTLPGNSAAFPSNSLFLPPRVKNFTNFACGRPRQLLKILPRFAVSLATFDR
jgi:hypothetical protein